MPSSLEKGIISQKKRKLTVAEKRSLHISVTRSPIPRCRTVVKKRQSGHNAGELSCHFFRQNIHSHMFCATADLSSIGFLKCAAVRWTDGDFAAQTHYTGVVSRNKLDPPNLEFNFLHGCKMEYAGRVQGVQLIKARPGERIDKSVNYSLL